MGVVAAAFLAPPASAHPSTLFNHREVHEFTPTSSSASAAVTMTGGRLVTEVTGSACGGYTESERFVMRGIDDQDQDTLTDIRSRIVEKGDQLTFSDESFDEGGSTDRSSGTATRTAGGLTVKMDKPWKKSFTFDTAPVFPMEQEQRIIAAGLAGKRFLSFDVYDGSPDGETVYATSTIIGAQSTSANDFGAESAIADAGFAGLRHWPVTISYYEKTEGVDSAPVYEMRTVLYENGVRRSIVLSYESGLVLSGTLTRIDALSQPDCLR